MRVAQVVRGGGQLVVQLPHTLHTHEVDGL
jgi:hypothetical protein